MSSILFQIFHNKLFVFLQIAVTLPIALYHGHNLLGPAGSRLLLLFQGIVGGTLLVLLFYSFRLLPLGDAATIIFRWVSLTVLPDI